MSDRPQNATPEPVEDDLPEQMRVRRSKRERLLEEGGAAYPVTVERTHTLAEVRATYDAQELEPDTRTGEQVAVTGRVMFCLLYTSPSPRDGLLSRMPSSA